MKSDATNVNCDSKTKLMLLNLRNDKTAKTVNLMNRHLVKNMNATALSLGFVVCVLIVNMLGGCSTEPTSDRQAQSLKSQTSPKLLKQAFAQKLMLDLRYYCGDKSNHNTKKQCLTPMTVLPSELADMIAKSNLGGVILFSDNLVNTSQIVQLTHDLQVAASRSSSALPLFISLDQEGGRVARLPRQYATSFNGNMAIGATYSKFGTQYASKVGHVVGKELQVTGFNVNHAPNVDVNINPYNPVINVRSYGENPSTVAQLGLAQLTAMQQHNVIGTLKHFPGHGDTNVDSHTGLPRVNHGIDKIKQVDLLPFEYAINNQQVDMIMTAHIQYPALDNSTFVSKTGKTMIKPATMSHTILTELLRDKMRYKGLVITDALDMKGISEFFTETEAVIKTFNAGTDIALMPFKIRYKQDIVKLETLLNSLTTATNQQQLNIEQTLASYQRIVELKNKYQLNKSIKTPLQDKIQTAQQVLGSPKHRKLEQSLSDHSITILKGNPVIANQTKAVLLLMPDESKCSALTKAIKQQRIRFKLRCSSMLSSDEKVDRWKVKISDVIIAANITPKQTLVEIGGMDDLKALKNKLGYMSTNKKRLDTKLTNLMRYAKQLNKKVTFVSLRMPYEAKRYAPYSDSLIATFAYNQYSSKTSQQLVAPVYNSLAKVLMGRLHPTGTLPITVEL